MVHERSQGGKRWSSLIRIHYIYKLNQVKFSVLINHLPRMDSTRTRYLLFVLSLICTFSASAAAEGGGGKHQHGSTAFLVGTVYCDTCFHQERSKPSYFISGASVAVECGSAAAANHPNFRKEVTTDRRGVFRVRLPPPVSKHIRLIKSCSVKLIKSNEPFCAVASSSTTGGPVRLRSRKNGVHVFSVGFFTFKPLNHPELCSQKPILRDRKIDLPAFFFPTPSIPFLPSPPNIGGIPLPPNPLQPPAPFLPPINIPPVVPVPLLAPPPPPPAIIPGLPFPPNPLFPGIPPAFDSKEATP